MMRRMMRWFMMIMLVVACTHGGVAIAEPTDLPLCAELASTPGQEAIYRIGSLHNPGNEALSMHLITLSRMYEDVVVCQESWSAVLPRMAPWGPVASLERYYGYAAFVAGAVFWLFILAALTPTEWWRRPTVLGLLSIFCGAWICAVALLNGVNALGLPQKWLVGDVVSLQKGYANGEWVAVQGVPDLDRFLAGRGLAPDFTKPRISSSSILSSGVAEGDSSSTNPEAAVKGEISVVEGDLNLRAQLDVIDKQEATFACGECVTR